MKSRLLAPVAFVAPAVTAGPLEQASDQPHRISARARTLWVAASADCAGRLERLVAHLQAHPELSFGGPETSARVANQLRTNQGSDG